MVIVRRARLSCLKAWLDDGKDRSGCERKRWIVKIYGIEKRGWDGMGWDGINC